MRRFDGQLVHLLKQKRTKRNCREDVMTSCISIGSSRFTSQSSRSVHAFVVASPSRSSNLWLEQVEMHQMASLFTSSSDNERCFSSRFFLLLRFLFCTSFPMSSNNASWTTVSNNKKAKPAPSSNSKSAANSAAPTIPKAEVKSKKFSVEGKKNFHFGICSQTSNCRTAHLVLWAAVSPMMKIRKMKYRKWPRITIKTPWINPWNRRKPHPMDWR